MRIIIGIILILIVGSILVKAFKRYTGKKIPFDDILNNKPPQITQQELQNLKPGTMLEHQYLESSLHLPAFKDYQSSAGYYATLRFNSNIPGTVVVSITGKESGAKYVITHEQVKTLNYLQENQKEISDAILDAFMEYLPELKDIYEDALPAINSKEDFKKHIGPAIVHINTEAKNGFAYTGFEFSCNWEDDDYGLGIMIHQSRVIFTGAADRAFNYDVMVNDRDI